MPFSRPNLPYTNVSSPNDERYQLLSNSNRPPTAVMVDADINYLIDSCNNLDAQIAEIIAGNIPGSDDPANADLLLTTDGSGHLSFVQATTASIANQSINASKIFPQTITAAQIANQAIGTNQIANQAITSTQIANQTITSTKISDDTITNTQIADNTISKTKLVNSIGTADVRGTILGGVLQPNSIGINSINSVGNNTTQIYFTNPVANTNYIPLINPINDGSNNVYFWKLFTNVSLNYLQLSAWYMPISIASPSVQPTFLSNFSIAIFLQ